MSESVTSPNFTEMYGLIAQDRLNPQGMLRVPLQMLRDVAFYPERLSSSYDEKVADIKNTTKELLRFAGSVYRQDYSGLIDAFDWFAKINLMLIKNNRQDDEFLVQVFTQIPAMAKEFYGLPGWLLDRLDSPVLHQAGESRG